MMSNLHVDESTDEDDARMDRPSYSKELNTLPSFVRIRLAHILSTLLFFVGCTVCSFFMTLLS